jgi:hypothetical protein
MNAVSIEIEYLGQEAFALSPGMAIVVVTVVAVIVRIRRGARLRLRRSRHTRRTFDDFVQFAAIQPNAAALRAVIDFDTLSLGHH